MSVLKALMTSKKFLAMLIGCVLAIAVRLGMDPEAAKPVAEQIVALVAAYVVSQGVADHGKERALIQAGGPPVTNSSGTVST